MIIPCTAGDLDCSWTGPRDQLNYYLNNCSIIRSKIENLSSENFELKKKLQKRDEQLEKRKRYDECFEVVKQFLKHFEVQINNDPMFKEALQQFRLSLQRVHNNCTLEKILENMKHYNQEKKYYQPFTFSSLSLARSTITDQYAIHRS